MSQDKQVLQIYQRIIDTYPFLNKQELLGFQESAQKILANKKLPQLVLIQKILKLLNNQHADIKLLFKGKSSPRAELKLIYKIEDGILYIEIPSWTKSLKSLDKELINVCVQNENKYQGIILDVRENQGGDSILAHNFAGIFFKKAVTYGKIIKNVKGDGLKKLSMVQFPNKKIYINKPIIILISRKSFSSNELFLAPFKIAGRAKLVGTTTGGGSANPVRENITLSSREYVLRIPTWRFFLKGQRQPLEETKITPDIFYHKNDIVEFAQKLLSNNKNNFLT